MEYLGEFDSSSEIDVSQYAKPNDTVDNYICEPVAQTVLYKTLYTSQGSKSGTSNFYKTYSNGILSIQLKSIVSLADGTYASSYITKFKIYRIGL